VACSYKWALGLTREIKVFITCVVDTPGVPVYYVVFVSLYRPGCVLMGGMGGDQGHPWWALISLKRIRRK